MVIAVLASLVAALLYATASVLQHRAAREVPADQSLRLSLLARLIAKPWWLAGIAADGLAFVMQFIALGHGPLVVVQPLLVSGLLFALPLGGWISGAKIKASDIRAAALVVVGLAGLLVIANPTQGSPTLTGTAWIFVTLGVLLPVIALVVVARSFARPVLLAAAAGALYGLTAALAKVVSHELGLGIGHVLTSWEVWALIPGGILGMVLCQSAFQAGPLEASLPTLTAVDPLVSIAIGVFAFHEEVGHQPGRICIEVAGTLLMIVGVFLLGRSPLIALEDPHGEDGCGPPGTTTRSSDAANH